MNLNNDYAELIKKSNMYDKSLFLADGVIDYKNRDLLKVKKWDIYLNADTLHTYNYEQGSRELREEYLNISGLQNICELKNILVSTGSTSALYATIKLVKNLKKSKVLLVAPCWRMYGIICNNLGIRSSYCIPKDKVAWKHTFDDLKESMDSDVGAIVIANPGNPTGELFSDELLEQIYLYCKTQKIFLFLDETYWGLPDKRSDFINMYAGDENLVIIRSLSKYFCMAGIRIGFVLTTEKIASQVEENLRAMNLTCSPICQEIALRVLQNKMIEDYDYNFIVKNLNKFKKLEDKYESIHVVTPEAGFFLTFSIGQKEYVDFDNLFNKTKLIFRDGNGFQMKGYFRANLSLNEKIIDETVRRLTEYLETIEKG